LKGSNRQSRLTIEARIRVLIFILRALTINQPFLKKKRRMTRHVFPFAEPGMTPAMEVSASLVDVLEFQSISKYFPGVMALYDISFEAYGGEVLAFL
jgi:hypothetical protein